LCSLSLTVSTEQVRPSAGSTAFAAVIGVCVARRTIASSCSVVVALLRPQRSRVSTVPSLSNLFSHLFTVRCWKRSEHGLASVFLPVSVVGALKQSTQRPYYARISQIEEIRFIYRAIDGGGDLSQTQTGLVHSHHPIPQFGSRLVDASRLAHLPRLRVNGPGGDLNRTRRVTYAKEGESRDERRPPIVAYESPLSLSLSLFSSLSKLGFATTREHPGRIRFSRILGLTQASSFPDRRHRPSVAGETRFSTAIPRRFLSPADAGTSTSRDDHHPRRRRAGSSSSPKRSAPRRSGTGGGEGGGYSKREGHAPAVNTTAAEYSPSRFFCPAAERRVGRRRDAGTRASGRGRVDEIARNPGSTGVAPRTEPRGSRRERVVGHNPADCTAPPSVQSAAIDASDRCAVRNFGLPPDVSARRSRLLRDTYPRRAHPRRVSRVHVRHHVARPRRESDVNTCSGAGRSILVPRTVRGKSTVAENGRGSLLVGVSSQIASCFVDLFQYDAIWLDMMNVFSSQRQSSPDARSRDLSAGNRGNVRSATCIRIARWSVVNNSAGDCTEEEVIRGPRARTRSRTSAGIVLTQKNPSRDPRVGRVFVRRADAPREKTSRFRSFSSSAHFYAFRAQNGTPRTICDSCRSSR